MTAISGPAAHYPGRDWSSYPVLAGPWAPLPEHVDPERRWRTGLDAPVYCGPEAPRPWLTCSHLPPGERVEVVGGKRFTVQVGGATWTGDGSGAYDIATLYPPRGAPPLAGLEPHPAPEVSSREGRVPAAWPGPVFKLAQEAREWGWEVSQQWSRGHGVHGSTGRPTALKDRYALRFGLHPLTDARAYAVHAGGAWESCRLSDPMVGLSVTELRHWLECGGQVEPGWFAELAARAAEVAARPRKPAKKKAKEGLS